MRREDIEHALFELDADRDIFVVTSCIYMKRNDQPFRKRVAQHALHIAVAHSGRFGRQMCALLEYRIYLHFTVRGAQCPFTKFIFRIFLNGAHNIDDVARYTKR